MWMDRQRPARGGRRATARFRLAAITAASAGAAAAPLIAAALLAPAPEHTFVLTPTAWAPPTPPDAGADEHAEAELPDAAEPGDPESEGAGAGETRRPPERREASLLLMSGRQISGFLLDETPERVVLEISGVSTPFDRKDVRAMRILEPVDVRYQRMREQIAPNDAAGRVQLANWLIERRRYQEALDEVRIALVLEPYNERAIDMERLLRSQVRLEERRRQGPPDEPASAIRTRDRERIEELATFPALSDDDINAIRIFELDLRRPGTVTIPPELIDRLVDLYGNHELMPQTRQGRDALYRAPARDILRLLFQLRARELYPLVRVHDDPPAIQTFRRDVHSTWLVNRCATFECHGGQQAGRLYLRRKARNTDATVYTNLYILDQFRFADGEPLINYERPADSRLLQMTLPREVSTYPHPEVGGPVGGRFRPIFRTPNERGFRAAVQWISSMYTPRPSYGIHFTPPEPGEVGRQDR